MERSPQTKKHFYHLTDQTARRQAADHIESFEQLASDADQVWHDNGYQHILVNQLCLTYRYHKSGDLLYIECRTRHRSELENR